MAVDWARRAGGEERMDRADLDAEELRDALGFLRFLNRWLLGARASIGALRPLLAGRDALTLLDAGTGGGEVAAAMARFAARRGLRLRPLGLDLHPLTVRSGEPFPRVRADARRLPFPDRSVDVVHASLFLHHLSDAGAVQALREMARVARVGLVVNDLRRGRRAYAWAWLLTRFRHPGVRHDALLSVLRGFTRAEVLGLAARAGLAPVDYVPRFGHRFALSWTRS